MPDRGDILGGFCRFKEFKEFKESKTTHWSTLVHTALGPDTTAQMPLKAVLQIQRIKEFKESKFFQRMEIKESKCFQTRPPTSSAHSTVQYSTVFGTVPFI